MKTGLNLLKQFIKENRFTKFKFNWQEGFGAFLYSISQIDNVVINGSKI